MQVFSLENEVSFLKDEMIIPGNHPAVVPSITATGNGIAIGTLNDGLHLHLDGASEETVALLGRLFGLQQLPAPEPEKPSYRDEWMSLSTDSFCLFVLENEEYKCGSFCISKSRALEKYTSREHRTLYRALSPAAQESIMKMPCIFARRNPSYRYADDDYPALLGRITGITCQRDNIRFAFQPYSVIYQCIINRNIAAFNLVYSSLRNELDEEHWSIRSGNLQNVVAQLGVVIE
jgi:hypothetical protein